MRRSPAVILVAALALAALTARLGFWQLDRAAQKNERQASIDQRRALPPLQGEAVLARSLAELQAQLWRAVTVQGRWAAAHTVYLDNRPMNSRVGFIVLTPLLLDDGTAVIVQRGWQPRDALDRTRVLEPPTPQERVTVLARIAPAPARLYEFEASKTGTIRQNLDLEAFGAETGLRLRPLSLQQLTSDSAAVDGLLRDWPQPAADVHKHYGYAFQWFALSLLTLVLYAWFQIIRPKRSAGRRVD